MGFVGNLVLFTAVKKTANQSRTDKIIAVVRMAHFLTHSVCYI